jgi:hypothetical protein
MNKRLHIYLTEAQIDALKTYANKEHVSVSRLVRNFVAGFDPIRDYRPDGKHTAEVRTDDAITNILRKVAH